MPLAPLSQTVTPRIPSPSRMTYFMDGPYVFIAIIALQTDA